MTAEISAERAVLRALQHELHRQEQELARLRAEEALEEHNTNCAPLVRPSKLVTHTSKHNFPDQSGSTAIC